MSKAEEFALEKYPIFTEDVYGHKIDVNLWQRKACVEGYHQAEKDYLLKINHLVNKVDIDNDAHEDLEDLYDSLCELIKHNRIGYIPEKDLELTWEDIREIYCTTLNFREHLGASVFGEPLYKEVLKRFKDFKERKNE